MKAHVAMHRTFLALAVYATVGIGGMTLAQHAQHSRKSPGKGDPAVPAGNYREAGW